jgi:AcrR family transcriptional regulator
VKPVKVGASIESLRVADLALFWGGQRVQLSWIAMAAVDPATERAVAFPRLQAGRGAPSPENVARHQKARLEGAMVEAVARHGYADTSLRELVAIAGISKSAFYEHFESKQECFFATFDEIVAELGQQVGEAYRAPGDFREKLVAGLQVVMRMASEQPEAAALVAVEALTLGAAGVKYRERASAAFETLIQQSFDHSASPDPVSPLTVRAIVAGIRGVAYRRLRSREEAELPDLVAHLVDWALSYQDEPDEAVVRAMRAAEEPLAAADLKAGEAAKPGWEEPTDSRRSRELLSARERTYRAAAKQAVEQGYAALSIPAISAAAAISNKTFYKEFESKRDAFLAAFRELAGEAFAQTSAAMASATERPEALGRGARALLEYVAANELFAHLAFFELACAGPAAMDQADAVLDGFTDLLDPGKGEGARMPAVTHEAVGSGIWAVIQYEIAHGRRAELAAVAPAVAALAMTPLQSS